MVCREKCVALSVYIIKKKSWENMGNKLSTQGGRGKNSNINAK